MRGTTTGLENVRFCPVLGIALFFGNPFLLRLCLKMSGGHLFFHTGHFRETVRNEKP
jgi:hypothetical protein